MLLGIAPAGKYNTNIVMIHNDLILSISLHLHRNNYRYQACISFKQVDFNTEYKQLQTQVAISTIAAMVSS